MTSPSGAPDELRPWTRLLAGMRAGREDDRRELYALAYEDLRRIARRRVRELPPGATLQPTALVHETALRLFGRELAPQDRRHFFALAARAMGEVLIEERRRRGALKRGGAFRRWTATGEELGAAHEGFDLVHVQEALEALARVDATSARIVELRVYGGLAIDEVAAEVGASPATVDRRWAFARAWLARKLAEPRDDAD